MTVAKEDCRHLWFLVGDPPTKDPEVREFECDTCGERIVEVCDVGRADPYSLDPLREAVGRVIQDVYVLEIWLKLLASNVLERTEQDRQAARTRAANMQTSDHIAWIRKRAPSTLPPELSATLLALLKQAEEVLLARHHLVHGIWIPNQHGTAMWAQKSGRRGQPWTQQRFDRRSLLELHRTVTILLGRLQGAARKTSPEEPN